MRRILLVLTVAALMVAMIVVSVVPALAAPGQKPGQFTCFNQETFQYELNVPRGKTGQPQYYQDYGAGPVNTCYPQV